MRYSYHNHTYRCNHAFGEEKEYIERAIEAGIEEFGFSDHVPMPFEGEYYSYFRMRPSELDGYFYVLEGLRREYASDIKIRIGFEAEYYPAVFERMTELLSGYPYEYLILGQHALGNEEGDIYCSRECRDESQLKRYVDQVIEGIRTNKFLYVAHPDIFNFVGDMEYYKAEMSRLCRAAAEADILLEINTLGLREGRCYPNEEFWRLAASLGCRAVIGADAHMPEHVFDPYAVSLAEKLASRAGIEVIDRISF